MPEDTTTSMNDSDFIPTTYSPKVEEKVVKKKSTPKPKPERAKKEIYIEDAKKLYNRLNELGPAITHAISIGNATGIADEISAILKEFKRKLL